MGPEHSTAEGPRLGQARAHQLGGGVLAAVTGRVKQIVLIGHRRLSRVPWNLEPRTETPEACDQVSAGDDNRLAAGRSGHVVRALLPGRLFPLDPQETSLIPAGDAMRVAGPVSIL